MREIKFRARALSADKRWLYGSYLTRLNSRDGREHFIVGDDGIEHAVDGGTVGQSTDLHDRHGKEIYEGDILTFERTTSAVEYINNGFWVKDGERNWMPAEHLREIIGDIISTPHLLTV